MLHPFSGFQQGMAFKRENENLAAVALAGIDQQARQHATS